MRRATPQELTTLLGEHAPELERQLGVSPLQLSIPTDGRGLRVKVSVRPNTASGLPRSIQYKIGDEVVEVPLEVSEDYQEYELFGR